jgi:hypothetical protein
MKIRVCVRFSGAGFGVVFRWFGAGLGRVWFGYWFDAVLGWVTNPNDPKP